jgi:hypothetical protein
MHTRAILLLTIVAVLLSGPAAGQTIKFEPKAGVQTFAVREPVLRIKPGAAVETRTFSTSGDYYDPKVAGPWPGEVGPFHIGEVSESPTAEETVLTFVYKAP